MADISLRKGVPPFPTPPYIAFLRLKALVQSLRQDGVPNRLDLPYFAQVPATDRRPLLATLQYLQLVDNFLRPTDDLLALVDAYETEQWRVELAGILRRAYEPLFANGLRLSTQDDLAIAFRRMFAGTDDVLRKCRTFFLHAAYEADDLLEQSVFNGIKRRSGPSARARVGRPSQPPAIAQPPERSSEALPLLPGKTAIDFFVTFYGQKGLTEKEFDAVHILRLASSRLGL